MVYAHLAHALSLNDICDSLSNHAGTLKQIRGCTPPSRNGLSHANKTRNADMAEELFWKVYESLSKQYPDFLTSSRNYPGLPHRFRRRIIRAVDSSAMTRTPCAGRFGLPCWPICFCASWHGTANGSIRSEGSTRLCAPSCGTTSRWTASSNAATPAGKAEKGQPSGAALKQPTSSHSGIFQRNSSTNKPTHKKGVLKKRRLCAQLHLLISHSTLLWFCPNYKTNIIIALSTPFIIVNAIQPNTPDLNSIHRILFAG